MKYVTHRSRQKKNVLISDQHRQASLFTRSYKNWKHCIDSSSCCSQYIRVFNLLLAEESPALFLFCQNGLAFWACNLLTICIQVDGQKGSRDSSSERALTCVLYANGKRRKDYTFRVSASKMEAVNKLWSRVAGSWEVRQLSSSCCLLWIMARTLGGVALWVCTYCTCLINSHKDFSQGRSGNNPQRTQTHAHTQMMSAQHLQIEAETQITKLPQIVATNKQFICLYNSCRHRHTHTYTLSRRHVCAHLLRPQKCNSPKCGTAGFNSGYSDLIFGVASHENLINLCKNTQPTHWRGAGTVPGCGRRLWETLGGCKCNQ